MAVYTNLGAEELAQLIAEFDVGELTSAKGIAEGVSNSNWLIETTGKNGTGARFILTMYEFRIDITELPFFLGLLDHLAAKNCPVPATIHDRNGSAYRMVGDKAVALIEFLPGVSVSDPTPAQARALVAAAPALHGPLFEAHSTDYQTEAALSALVRDHFAVLKVGPELTFAYRQAVFALERLEALLGLPASGVTAALLAAMRARPADWRAYVETGATEETMMLFGLSDRLRYYWPVAEVQAAQARLFAALRQAPTAPGLLAQVTGGLVAACDPACLPETVIRQMVGAVVQKYRSATGA